MRNIINVTIGSIALVMGVIFLALAAALDPSAIWAVALGTSLIVFSYAWAWLHKADEPEEAENNKTPVDVNKEKQ